MERILLLEWTPLGKASQSVKTNKLAFGDSCFSDMWLQVLPCEPKSVIQSGRSALRPSKYWQRTLGEGGGRSGVGKATESRGIVKRWQQKNNEILLHTY